MIFEARSQLNKQQQAEHGGAVRGTDAARVQVPLSFCHPHKNAHARMLAHRVSTQRSMFKTVAECLVSRLPNPTHNTMPAVVIPVEVEVLQKLCSTCEHQ